MERGGQEGEKILNVFQKLEMRLKCTVCNKGIKLAKAKQICQIMWVSLQKKQI